MVVGIGTDIQLISGFANKKNKVALLNKLFTERELSILKSKSTKSYAGFFCVKEALVKALGTGFVGIRPTDIEIAYLENGKPFVTLHNKALEVSTTLKVNNIHVSISHSGEYAQAFVVLESI